jgi:iron complex outermembrane recepter protein
MPILPAPARRLLLACVAASALGCADTPASAAPPVSNASALQTYDLKAQPLDAALRAVALRSGRAILAPSSLLAGKRAPPLKGEYTAIDAVRTLLAGSGLDLTETGEALIVREPAGPRSSAESTAAQTASTVAEVMVTGSHIRGAQVAAPVDVITRTDIEQTGYSDIGDVIRSLPEDYGGGQNPGVLSGAAATNQANQNTTNASSINLRGLGSDATLVLLDGHRLAADGGFQAPDVSVIPLAAIERIDVVTDGASALYGSDAVAGVANFILRKNYDGAELSEVLGGATQGGGFEQTYNALAGKTWSSGHLLADVEYSDQDQISTGQRAFTSTASPLNALLQAQTRTSVFVNAGQDLASWASFHIDGLFSQRQTPDLNQFAVGAPVFTYATTVQSYFTAPGVSFTLPGSWTATLDGTASGTTDDTNLTFTGGGLNVRYRNTAESIEAAANGDALSLPSGNLKLAIGAGYREEGFAYLLSTPPSAEASRGVAYLYAEAYAPLVQPSEDRLGLNALDLTLAGRIERYTDFGFTANPKIGLRYKPMPSVTLRATWGTSFKAPEFVETALPTYLYLYDSADLGGTKGTTLFSLGGSPDLKPEQAQSWTGGIDWSPTQAPSLRVSITYFNIDYRDRIVQPVTNLGTALSDPTYAPFVTSNPTAAQQAAVIAGASEFLDNASSAYDPTQVSALVQDRYVNATVQKINGVDLSIKDSIALPLGRLDGFVAVSWLRILQQTLPTLPVQTLTGTLFNPPTARLRSGLTWTDGGFSVTGILNYVAGETDTGVTPNVPIGSWTTADFNLSYRFGKILPQLPGLETSLSITNAFDRNPPFAQGAAAQFPGIFFDSTNASAIGRFVALTLRQRF